MTGHYPADVERCVSALLRCELMNFFTSANTTNVKQTDVIFEVEGGFCECTHVTADTFFGTMYTSDDRGILFSKSLERHLFDGQRKSDFTNVTSLRGVYLTNKLDHGKVCSLSAIINHCI